MPSIKNIGNRDRKIEKRKPTRVKDKEQEEKNNSKRDYEKARKDKEEFIVSNFYSNQKGKEMLVKLNDKTYKVQWKHYADEPEEFTGTKICSCDITCDEDPTFIAMGMAYCAKGDNYNKETGRKISLTWALHEMPRTDREVFWKTYFSRKGK